MAHFGLGGTFHKLNDLKENNNFPKSSANNCGLCWPFFAFLAFSAHFEQVDLQINLHNSSQSLMVLAFLDLFSKSCSDLSSDQLRQTTCWPFGPPVNLNKI
jgi:hypothetical protein